MNRETLAREIEAQVHARLTKSNRFVPKQAQLYVVHNDNDVIDLSLADTNMDIYDLLLDDETSFIANKNTHIVLVTGGYAAPLNNGEVSDIPPSEHKDRRRVRLMIIASNGEQTSIMRFEDDDNIQVDLGNATGALAEAISQLYKETK